MFMKTKSNLMIVSIILMLVFNSCSDMKDGVILQDDESIVLSPEEYVSVAYDTPKTISTQQAVDMCVTLVCRIQREVVCIQL